MAEAGVPESTMLALLGHMSRAMLERYSHVRMAAKREAVEVLSLKPKAEKPDALVKEIGQSKQNYHDSIGCKLLILMVSAVGIEPTT